MGMVMIRCPRTGREIPTGIRTEPSRFACTPVFFADTDCPACGQRHQWFAREAWVAEGRTDLATAA